MLAELIETARVGIEFYRENPLATLVPVAFSTAAGAATWRILDR